ncbi:MULTISPECIES: putative porin [Pseudoalteromonas]|uniref:putative porin n=1 Tax=Pseudoalteromonas TaxID=53246 RepID=UPI001EFEB3E4|nr:putative porin [Pseudoalteromonas piscicida]MCG9769090.1 putative porin [Pseudoalteromonas piscicida]
MKKLLSIAAVSLLVSAAAQANTGNVQKEWFNAASYTDYDYDGSDNRALMLSSRYFFAPQESVGVWDDFGYLDTDSNVGVSYFNDDYSNAFSAGGEGFITKEWFVTAGIADLGEADDHYSFGFGYLYNDNLKLSIRQEEFENGDTTWFKAEYNHELNSTDYIGFTVETEDEFDYLNLSARYFMHVGGDSYFTIDLEHNRIDTDGFDDNVTNVLANYYFTRNFALGLGSYDSDLAVEAKYFFNDTYYLKGSVVDTDGGETSNLTFVAQF